MGPLLWKSNTTVTFADERISDALLGLGTWLPQRLPLLISFSLARMGRGNRSSNSPLLLKRSGNSIEVRLFNRHRLQPDGFKKSVVERAIFFRCGV